MRENNPIYGYSFNEFLNIAERANLGIKREPKPDVGGGFQVNIMFNFYSSLKKYSDALSSHYLEIGPNANHILDNIELKVHKLNYLTGMLAEINGAQSLIFKNEKGEFEHAFFEFADLSDAEYKDVYKLSQSDIQPYLITLNRYITMVKDVIEGIKKNTEATLQSDLPIPRGLRIKPEDSTLELPDKYFDYLVAKNGVNNLKLQFKPVEDEYGGYDHISYDEESETKTYYDRDYETGDYTETKKVFSHQLLEVLVQELFKFKSLVDQSLAQTNTASDAIFYVEKLVSRLKYLLQLSQTSSFLVKYENIVKALKACLRFLYEKYPAYCPSADFLISEILKDSLLVLEKPKESLLIEPKNPPMFRWTKEPNQRLTILLHELLSGRFIEKIDLTLFAKVFEGGFTDHKPAIKWIDKPRSGAAVNKVSLLYLFKSLADAELIDIRYDTPEMIGRLEYIFTDVNGGRLTNWIQSKKSIRDIKGKTPEREEIDRIVSLLTSELAI